MFWIMGGENVVKAVARWGGWKWAPLVETQLEHAPWDGFRFYDLIFPLFLFIVGVVLPYSLNSRHDSGASPGRLHLRILRRTLLLILLGLIFNDLLQFDFDNLRYAGVLQRIAVCYGVTALVVLHSGWRLQAAVVAVLLLGYWGVLLLVPAPGFQAGDLTIEGNLAGYIDRTYLPGKIYEEWYGEGDNEGLLSTLPAIATTILGALTGHWLRSGITPWRKVGGLFIAGAIALALGNFWGAYFPVIKNLWTSSFVLVATGYSLWLLAFFYAVIDVLGWKRWAFPFLVIGSNAILIYLLPGIVDFEHTARFLLGGVARVSGEFAPVVLTSGVMLLEWLVLWALYRRGLFLRV